MKVAVSAFLLCLVVFVGGWALWRIGTRDTTVTSRDTTVTSADLVQIRVWSSNQMVERFITTRGSLYFGPGGYASFDDEQGRTSYVQGTFTITPFED